MTITVCMSVLYDEAGQGRLQPYARHLTVVNSALNMSDIPETNVFCHIVNHLPLLPGCCKKRFKTHCIYSKVCQSASCVNWSSFLQPCYKCPHCCCKATCRGHTAPILGNMGWPKGQSQGHMNPQRRLHPPLPELTTN